MVLTFYRRGSVIPIYLYLLVGRHMKEGIGGLRNESSKTKRTGIFQRITAAFPLPLIIKYKKVSSTFLPNLSLFWHINEGIEEIMADHIHREMTRNWILFYLRLFLLIVIKDVFLSLVSFLNKKEPNGSNSYVVPCHLNQIFISVQREGGLHLITLNPLIRKRERKRFFL